MSKNEEQSTLLLAKYLDLIEKDPKSRVFAPLAEVYRKLGMLDRALEVLNKGLAFHPDYILGHLGLAFCYFELEQYKIAYKTLKPYVTQSRDNIRLQKLFASICEHIEELDESLETYKYLLFLNPKDQEVAKKVTELENILGPIEETQKKFNSLLNEGPAAAHLEINIKEMDIGPEPGRLNADDWAQVSLPNENEKKAGVNSEDSIEDWSVEKSSIKESSNENIEIAPVLDIDNEEKTPVITHTLVDLYCAQGHFQKALEILGNILSLNPQDQKTVDKISEIEGLFALEEELENDLKEKEMISKTPSVITKAEVETDEDDGREKLMSLYDSTVESEINTVEDRLWDFHAKLSSRAKEVLSSNLYI